MNFYHFRPSCKVIKRSRTSKGPFFTNYNDEVVRAILTNSNTYLKYGDINLKHLGIFSQYSRKVFIGGLPLDITEDNVIGTFNKFGSLVVDWPYKEDTNATVPPKGFAFLIFENNFSIDLLIDVCEKKIDGYYLQLSSITTKNKTVQIRPWKLSGIDHVFVSITELNERNTVFVGGVPRTITAEQLGVKMANLFGKVAYAGIDTDPDYLYPKGAARVTFKNISSVVTAIKKRFLMPSETKTRKMMEIKPFILDDQICDQCDIVNVNDKNPILFCPETECLQYLCEFCWAAAHSFGDLKNHKPLVKQGLEDYMNSLKKRGYE